MDDSVVEGPLLSKGPRVCKLLGTSRRASSDPSWRPDGEIPTGTPTHV